MDVPRYVYYVLKIIKTKNPLISYSAFPDLNPISVYYPSLFHIIIGALTVVTSILGGSGGIISSASVLNTLTPFVFAMYVVGIVGYALVIKKIVDTVIYNNGHSKMKHELKDAKYLVAYYTLLLFAFGLFIYSTSPMVNTFRDGAYGSIFSIWALFPFYLYLLFNKRWIASAVLLAVIASTHNLSFLMALAVTMLYLGSQLLSREYSIKKLTIPIILFLILSLPAMIFFYIPSITEFVTGVGTGIGVTHWWTKTEEMQTLTPVLYYAGIIASLSILFIDVKRLWWLTGWAVLYFPLFSASFMGAERFGRELCLPFGLVVGICSAIVIHKLIFVKYPEYALRIKGHRALSHNLTNRTERMLIYHTDNKQVLSVLLIVVLVLSGAYGYFDQFFKYNSYPIVAYWHSDAMAESNRYFLHLNSSIAGDAKEAANPTILVFGENPWLPATVSGKFRVLAVEGVEEKDPISALYGSIPDREINAKLRAILENPGSRDALLAIKQYNIRYIYISDLIPNRWYGVSDWSDKHKLIYFNNIRGLLLLISCKNIPRRGG
jgi:hypothetical protein